MVSTLNSLRHRVIVTKPEKKREKKQKILQKILQKSFVGKSIKICTSPEIPLTKKTTEFDHVTLDVA